MATPRPPVPNVANPCVAPHPCYEVKKWVFHYDCFVHTEYRLVSYSHLFPDRGTEHTSAYCVPVRLSKDANLVNAFCGDRDDIERGLQTTMSLRHPRAGETATSIVGVLVGSRRELPAPWTSIMSQIPMKMLEPVSWQPMPDVPSETAVWVLKGNPEASPCRDMPILQTFLDKWIEGLLEVSREYAEEAVKNVTGFNEFWLNDRELPRRPWIHTPKYKIIDELLKKHKPLAYAERRVESEFSVHFTECFTREAGQESDRPSSAPARHTHRQASMDRVGLDPCAGKLAVEPSDFVFGFGSLLNSISRMSTNPEAKDAIPCRIVAEFGLVRSWNFRSDTAGLTALGLRKVGSGEGRTINGVLYPVYDLAQLDEREAGYDRVKIPAEMLQAAGWQPIPAGLSSWVYIPRQQQDVASVTHPILQTYVDVCVLGCLEYSEEFAREFIESTVDWSPYWLNDRKLARRPWVYQPRYKEVDCLLKKYCPGYAERKLDVEFAACFRQELEDNHRHHCGDTNHDHPEHADGPQNLQRSMTELTVMDHTDHHQSRWGSVRNLLLHSSNI